MKNLLTAIALTAATTLAFVAPSAHAGSNFNIKKNFGHQGNMFNYNQQDDCGPAFKFDKKDDKKPMFVNSKPDKKDKKDNKKPKFGTNKMPQWNNWFPKGGDFCLPPVKDDCKPGKWDKEKEGDCKAVPTPSAAAAGLIGLAGLAARRRRRSELTAE